MLHYKSKAAPSAINYFGEQKTERNRTKARDEMNSNLFLNELITNGKSLNSTDSNNRSTSLPRADITQYLSRTKINDPPAFSLFHSESGLSELPYLNRMKGEGSKSTRTEIVLFSFV